LVKLLFILGLLVGSYFMIAGVLKKNHLLFLATTLCSFSFLYISNVDMYNALDANSWTFLPFHFLYVSLPLFLLYIKSVSIVAIKKSDFLILIPGVLEILYLSYMWSFKQSDGMLSFLGWRIYLLLAFSFNVVLALYGVCKLNGHFKNRFYMYSYFGKRHLKWLKKMLLSVPISLVLFGHLSYLGYGEQVSFLNNIYLLILLLFICYLGIISRNIDDFESKQDYKEVCKKELYMTLGIIKEYLLTTEDYLKINYSQLDLSQSIAISPHKISMVVNTLTDKSYSSYINCLRVQKAIVYLNDEKYKQYTIDAIAKEVGFNSKSVFYKAFRKTTGFTPLRYKKLFL